MPTAPTSATTGLKILQQGPTPIPDTFNQTTNPINPHATGLEEGAIITPITSFTQAGSRLRDSSSQRNSSILYNASEDERRRNFLQEKLDNQYNTFLRRTQGKGRLFDVDRLIDKQASIRSRNKSMGLVGDLESVYGNLATWSDEFNDINLEMEYNKRISSGLDAFTPDLREAEGDLKQLFKNEKDRRGIKTRELNRRERNEIAKTYSRRVSLGRDPVQGSFLERWADKLPPVLDAIPIVTDTLNAFASQAGISASEYTRMSDEEKDNFKTAVKPAFKQGFVDALPIINKMATKKEGSFTVRGSSLLYDDIYVGNLKQTHGEQVGGNVGYIGGGIAGNVALYSAMSPILEAGILRASQGLKTAQATAKLQRSVKGSRVALGEDIAAIYSPSRLQQWAATNPLAFRMSVVNVAEETTQAIAMKTSGQEYTATDFYMGMLLGAGIEVVFDMVRARPGWRHLNQKSFVDQARADLETHVGDYFETFGSYRDVNRFGDFIGDQKIGTTGQTWDSMFKESRLIYYRDPEIRRRAGSGDLSDPQARYWRAVQKADGSAQFEEVRGAKKTRSLPNVDAFTYKAEDGVWHVIEERSGTSIGRADTRGGAIESAQTKLKEFEAGGGNFTALVQNAIDSNGISPRHAEPVTSKTSLPSGDPISPREREAFIDEVRRRVPRERLSENVNMEDIYQVQKALELTHDHGSFQPAAKDPNVKNIPKGTRKAAVSPEEIIAARLLKAEAKTGEVAELKPEKPKEPEFSFDILKQARKYKSAEEFVKAQPKLYHGTGEEFTVLKSKRQLRQAGSDVEASNIAGDSPFVFLSEDKNVAQGYASARSRNIRGEPRTIEIIPEGKMLDLTKHPTEYTADEKAIFKKMAEEIETDRGADAFIKYQLSSRSKGRVPSADISFTDIEGSQVFEDILRVNGFSGFRFRDRRISGGFSDSIAMLPDKVKTKSQLTDIWNKANKPNILPLLEGAQKKSGLRGIIKDLKDKSGVTPTPDRLIALEVSEAEKLIPANFRGSIDELRPLLRENGISDEAINRMRLVGRPLKDSVEMDADGKFEVDPRFWDDQLLAKAEGQIVEPPDPRALGDDFWSQARSGIHEVEQALMPTEVYANMVDGRPLTYDGVFMRTYMWPAQEASGTAFKNWYEWRTRHADARGDLTPEDVNATYWYGITQMEPPKESAFRTMRELVQYNLDRINTRARQSNPEHVDIVVPDGLSDGQQKLYSFWRKSMDDIHPEMNKASVDSTGEEVGFIERFLPIEIEKDELLAASIIADGKPPPYIKRRTPEFSHLNERRLSDLLLKQDSFTLMERYMQKAQYFTQVAPLGSRMKHAFEQPEFGQIYGRGAQKYFSDSWMQDFLRGNKTVSSPAWKSVNKFKSHVSSYALAFRIPSYLKQYMAGFNSSAKMDAVAGKAGTGLSYMKRGIRMRSDPEVRKLHLEMSEHLGRRVPDIAFTQLEAPKGDSVRDVLNGWSDIGLKPLKNADFEVAMSAHIAAKEFAVDELGKSLDEAMKFADSVVRTTQGSTDFENLPQAFKNDWGLLMMHFQTFVNANFNFVKEDLVKAGIIQQKAPPSAVAAGFTSVMMGVMLEKAISDQYYEFKTGREPRFSGNFLSWKYFATLGTDFIPGLSATGEGSPLGRTFGNLVTGVEGTRPDRAVKSAAALYGLPGGAQTADIYDFLFRKER